MTPRDREAIRQAARRQAERMGLRVRPEPKADEADPATLPTTNLFALRGLLHTGRLSPLQQHAARQVLADAAAAEQEAARIAQTADPNPGDAA